MNCFLTAYNRKKQPELVRKQLLDEATRLVAQDGVANVSLQAIAKAAGVTKGGLLHHFPTKEDLIKAMLANMLAQLGEQIDISLAASGDTEYGCFTRAYLKVVFEDCPDSDCCPEVIFECSKLYHVEMNQMWRVWIDARMEQHKDTDSDLFLEIMRCAGDGVWLKRTIHKVGPDKLEAIKAQMIAMTYINGQVKA